MSQIELSEKTRNVLEWVANDWTGTLINVNFDGRKLESEQQDLMNDSSYCYIGEIHHGSARYECNICEKLSYLAPHVFKTNIDEDNYNSNIKTCRDEGLDFEDLESPNVAPDKFLDYVAEHVKNKHQSIIERYEMEWMRE